jgi:ubiquitin-protein ligase
MATQATYRVMKEIKEFQDHPPANVYVRPSPPLAPLVLTPAQITYSDSNLQTLNALLIGPEGTPYEYGLFEFCLEFPTGTSLCVKRGDVDYPSKPPV